MELTNLNKDRKLRKKSPVDINTMMYGKLPPQAKDLEEAVLGAIMLEKSAFDTVIEILKPECFYVESHQRIYQVHAIPGPEKPAHRYPYGGGRTPDEGRTGSVWRTLLCYQAHQRRRVFRATLKPTPVLFSRNSSSAN